MELQVLSGKVKKLTQWKQDDGVTPKNYGVILVDDTKLSGWGAVPNILVEGKTYRFNYVLNGQYLNIKGLSEAPAVGEVQPVQQKEEIITDLNPRQRAISLGQAMNLSQAYIASLGKSFTEQEYDVEFRRQTRRFLKLIEELQGELL